MRYFIKLAYKGTHYHGWQIQPNASSVQEVIQQALSTILSQPIEIMGCGRTDTGVHAKMYYAHFDFNGVFPKFFIHRINKFLPNDIVFYSVKQVADDAHTRFDAFHRAYEYHILLEKNPFELETAWYYYQGDSIHVEQLQEVAELLLKYESFAPFCKSKHQSHTLLCDLKRSEWEIKPDRLIYHITSNRFLRGMVRLIVGACINVSIGKLTIEDIKTAMDNQTILNKSYSVPATGLYLTDIRYPYEV